MSLLLCSCYIFRALIAFCPIRLPVNYFKLQSSAEETAPQVGNGSRKNKQNCYKVMKKRNEKKIEKNEEKKNEKKSKNQKSF